MKDWELFENECIKHLIKEYECGPNDVKFTCVGGSNSSKSDILVSFKNNEAFYIEAKMKNAQAGQFVLIPNLKEKKFIYSSLNKTPINQMTKLIMNYMNINFSEFVCAGTSGKVLDMDENVFSKWIIEHYKERSVKYVITKDKTFIIFPIEKFSYYFSIVGKYRVKKSGSRSPTRKDYLQLKKYIEYNYKKSVCLEEDNKLFVYIDRLRNNRFTLGNFNYQLSQRKENKYEVRQLSNTNNANVIFEVSLKNNQKDVDLKKFQEDLNEYLNSLKK